LPIAIQPKAIEIALRASKHVISEKPIAPDVVSGRHLLQIAREVSVRTGTVWMIAENIRYEPVFQRAGEIIRRGDIGKLVQMDWTTASVFNRENKYYQTAWRRDNSFPGGLILDGGIHNIAAMRAVMGEIESVSAFVAQTRPDLPPADTLSAALRFVNGAIGSWTTTFAAESPWIDGALRILGDQGALRLNSGHLDFFSDGKTTTQAFPVNAVEQELTDFAQVIQGKTPFSTPEQALQDAIVMEAILDSARTGRIIQPECIV
jgi:glucose-fructose oxidoreductase